MCLDGMIDDFLDGDTTSRRGALLFSLLLAVYFVNNNQRQLPHRSTTYCAAAIGRSVVEADKLLSKNSIFGREVRNNKV